MFTKIAFTSLVLAVAGQRLWEVRKSKRHERALKDRGAVEHAPEQMPVMKAVHGAWLASTLAEVWLADRPFRPGLAAGALAVFAGGQALRLAAMRGLGERWTVKIITLPDEPPVSGGVFRYVRHPNYLGVVLEIAALPLMHGAWATALAFSAANGALLYARIRAEEQALDEASRYREVFAERPRFVPARGERTQRTR